MLSIFGDASHDETKQRVFAIAGVMGTEAPWDKITAKGLELVAMAPSRTAGCRGLFPPRINGKPKGTVRCA
jgi:hypothetical protein